MKNRKLIITIIVAVILILAGIILWKSFFTENKVPREFPELPPKRVEKELQEAALQKWGHEFIWADINENGEFCTIEEAWEQELLTKEQVALIAEYHEKAEEDIREYYRAQLPE